MLRTVCPPSMLIKMKERDSWNVPVTQFAKQTFNPIRSILENMKIAPHPEKDMIALSIGDPTVFGNLKPAEEVVEAVVESIRSGKNNGYIPSTGTQQAREAIAEYMTCPGAPVDAKDVIICSGCSCSLDLCISALCESGSTMLVPRPGFPLYTTLAKGYGIHSKYYDLLPEKNWLVDLDHLESLIDHTTSAIVINNPSNPCGSVFPKEHLEDIAALAIKHKIPIIADEIYDHFVFEGEEYHPIASVNPDLPVLACGGLTKRFLVPGWRTGWIAVHDRGGALQEVSAGLKTLSQRIIGSNTLVQGALPTILKHTPQAFFDDTIKAVQRNARFSYDAIQQIAGLTPTLPQGAMYMMVGIKMDEFPGFATDLEFVEKMVSEQSVFCLPGKCFDIPNYFRIVLTVPEAKMKEACDRMKAFCAEHHTTSNSVQQEDSIAKRVRRERTEAGSTSDEDQPTGTDCQSSPTTNGIKAQTQATNGTEDQPFMNSGIKGQPPTANCNNKRCTIMNGSNGKHIEGQNGTDEVNDCRQIEVNGRTSSNGTSKHGKGKPSLSNGVHIIHDVTKSIGKLDVEELAQNGSTVVKECAGRGIEQLVDFEMEHD